MAVTPCKKDRDWIATLALKKSIVDQQSFTSRISESFLLFAIDHVAHTLTLSAGHIAANVNVTYIYEVVTRDTETQGHHGVLSLALPAAKCAEWSDLINPPS